MARDWRKEFDDILKQRRQDGSADGAPEQPAAAEPVALTPGASIDALTARAEHDDEQRLRTEFGRAVEQMSNELINQIGQVRELASRKLARSYEQQLAEERRLLKEDEEAFYRAVERMFEDIRRSFSERLAGIAEDKRRTQQALDETRRNLEQRQRELELARRDAQAAQQRILELEQEMENARASTAEAADDYVQELEARLEEAYSLLRVIEETYLAIEGGLPA